MVAAIAWFVYFYLGIYILKYLFPLVKNKKRLFIKSFIIGTVFVISYHFIGIEFNFSSWYERGHIPPPGIFTIDGLQYYENGISLSQNYFNINKLPHSIGWTILWQFIIGFQFLVFGVNILIPKLFNVLLFSLASVAFSQLGFFISNNKKVSRYSYNLFLIFFPLLYYCSTLMREMFLAFQIIFSIYSYIMFIKLDKKKWFIFFLSFLMMLFFTRIEYFLFLLISILYVFILNKKMSLIRKIFILSIAFIIMILIIYSPIAQRTSLTDSITGEGGRSSRSVAVSSGNYVKLQGGYFSVIGLVLSNPVNYLKNFIFSVIQYFLDPLPTKWIISINDTRPSLRFFFSLFNMIHYFFLPALFFGVYYKLKYKLIYDEEKIIVLVILFNMFALSLLLRVTLRYSVPIFPLVFLFTAYGISIRRYWEKYVPYIMIIALIGVFFFTRVFDVKNLIG